MTKEERKKASENGKALKTILKILKNMSWGEAVALGINAQQMCKIKRGETVNFRTTTFERLKSKLGVEAA